MSAPDPGEPALSVTANTGAAPAELEVVGTQLTARYGAGLQRVFDLDAPFSSTLADLIFSLGATTGGAFTSGVIPPFTGGMPATVLIDQLVELPVSGVPAELRGIVP